LGASPGQPVGLDGNRVDEGARGVYHLPDKVRQADQPGGRIDPSAAQVSHLSARAISATTVNIKTKPSQFGGSSMRGL
jgi:hypothetical protein